MRPDAAMVFAAGFGTRMLPLTKSTPKPMLHVAGRPLLDYALDLVTQPQITRIVVNTHHLPEQVEGHLAGRDRVQCLREMPEVLETGGGLKNALPVLGSGPILTLNSDVVFANSNPVPTLLQQWDPARMDALLTLIPIEDTVEHSGVGDFFLEEGERLVRRGDRSAAPYVYGGVQILKTDGLDEFSENAFSLNVLWDRMLADGRAFGLVHPGTWVDVGRPEGLVAAEKALANV